jgi:diguanylate cyclase (GGDEF)-like protein
MASEAQAKHLAFHDALTGLPNRALFEDRLERALAAARRHPEDLLALFYLDLDRFKKVNDTLGHPAGDELLCEVAKRLTEVVRGSDTVARLGGDEFAILHTQLDSDQDIGALCERIIQAINAPFDLIGSQVLAGRPTSPFTARRRRAEGVLRSLLRKWTRRSRFAGPWRATSAPRWPRATS